MVALQAWGHILHRLQASLIHPRNHEDSQRNQPSYLKIFYWFYWYKKKVLNHYQYMTWPVPGSWENGMNFKQPTMSCQRPFGSRNRTNCRSIKTWKSLAVQTWTEHKDIESQLLIPCPSDDSSSRKCAEHRFVPSTSSDPKVSQQPVHSIWIPQTIRRWSYEFIETFWSIQGSMEHQCASRGSTVAPLFISNLGKISMLRLLGFNWKGTTTWLPFAKNGLATTSDTSHGLKMCRGTIQLHHQGPTHWIQWHFFLWATHCNNNRPAVLFFWLLLKWNNSWCWQRKPSHVPWFLGMSEVPNEKSWFQNYFRDNSVHVRGSCCHVGDDESQCATISQLKFPSDRDQWLNRCPTECSVNIEHHSIICFPSNFRI